MNAVKKYPIGIQNFEKLRKEGYAYVDKTSLIYNLVDSGNYYFLSRPRRFGKSLLVSTFEAYFEGKKELFEGLAIAELEKNWKKYPVIHLDLNAKKFDEASDLVRLIDRQLLVYENVYGTVEQDQTIDDRFVSLIRNMYRKDGERVVILVDEYDKPLLQSMGNEALQEEYRNILKAFYGVLKSMDGYIRFAMLTGVTKFGKVSVFSDLNNLMDISMDSRYVEICGITEKELKEFFDEDIRGLASANGQTYEEACAKLKENYDGYHFCQNSVGIYNPFSILNTFAKRQYGSYWFETGTPTYLVELLKSYKFNLPDLEQEKVTSRVLDSIDATSTNPIPVIYQSGYLTIKGYIPEPRIFELGFPNREVKEGFMDFLLPYYTSVSETETGYSIWTLAEDIKAGNISGFMERLKSFLAGCNYELALDIERHYQNVLYIVFRLVGFYSQVEYRTSQGRIDLVIQTKDYVYVMEFKLEGSAEEALKQIDDRQYALPFASDSRKVYKIGVNFSSQSRNIDKWVVE